MSKLFEHYTELNDRYGKCESANDALKQYLHIVQVMTVEEDNYKKHRLYMRQWLDNIEKHIQSCRADMRGDNDE